jgi:hypothetical protein
MRNSDRTRTHIRPRGAATNPYMYVLRGSLSAALRTIVPDPVARDHFLSSQVDIESAMLSMA